MFERFTEGGRRVVVLAQEEARLLNHNYIGTEHILLGLVRQGEGAAADALDSLGISLEAVRLKVEEKIGRGSLAPSGHIPFTPRAKKVLELSLREALQLGHNYIGTEHVLVGLIREGEGVAAEVLTALGADLSRVREVVLELVAGREHGAEAPPHASVTPLVRLVPSSPGGAMFHGPIGASCSFCGRDLWEAERFVRGESAVICDACVAAARAAVERSGGQERGLALPPRVFGPVPDADAVNEICNAFGSLGGGSQRPREQWLEDSAEVAPYLDEAAARNPVRPVTRVSRLRFLGPDDADVRFVIMLGEGGPTLPFEGRAVRRNGRWVISRETLAEILARGGVRVPPRE